MGYESSATKRQHPVSSASHARVCSANTVVRTWLTFSKKKHSLRAAEVKLKGTRAADHHLVGKGSASKVWARAEKLLATKRRLASNVSTLTPVCHDHVFVIGSDASTAEHS